MFLCYIQVVTVSYIASDFRPLAWRSAKIIGTQMAPWVPKKRPGCQIACWFGYNQSPRNSAFSAARRLTSPGKLRPPPLRNCQQISVTPQRAPFRVKIGFEYAENYVDPQHAEYDKNLECSHIVWMFTFRSNTSSAKAPQSDFKRINTSAWPLSPIRQGKDG